MTDRHVSRVCSSCWAMVRPGEYFPTTDRWDQPCCSCGDLTETARVTRAEAQAASADLFSIPADRPACCNSAEARFATFGPIVAARNVPTAVREGLTVMAFGYGDDPDDFDALTEDDLWAFEGPDPDPAVVRSWAPFRIWVDAGRVPTVGDDLPGGTSVWVGGAPQ